MVRYSPDIPGILPTMVTDYFTQVRESPTQETNMLRMVRMVLFPGLRMF